MENSNDKGISQADLDRIETVFNILDSNNDKKLTALELVRKGSMALGFSPTVDEAQDLVDDIDKSGTGEITYEQFKECMIEKLKKLDYEEKLLLDSFRKFDKNNDGFVTIEEMKTVLCRSGKEPMTEKEVESWLKDYDVDGDEKLNYEEFVTMFTNDFI